MFKFITYNNVAVIVGSAHIRWTNRNASAEFAALSKSTGTRMEVLAFT